ncbi:MAG: chromate efflux transporter [Acidobacteriota bacterium]
MENIQEPVRGSVVEVFLVFLRLGCVSFGGPIAHLGYIQKELVVERQWCDEDSYAEIIALAQSLPGPSSSQVSFGMGVLRAGWLGGAAAWTGFTLPSALLMFGFAFGTSLLSGPFGVRLIHGLQIVAVAVVAQAVLTMQRSLAPDRERIAIAIVALAVVLFGPAHLATLLAILGGGIAGVAMFPPLEMSQSKAAVFHASKMVGVACGLFFFTLLVLLPIAAHVTGNLEIEALSAFYRSGALVFGGGHVVLPLLENAVVAPGWVSQSTFLSGYGAAQALPGPLFTFGAFLGASFHGITHRILFGSIGLFTLSAPGLLAMAAVLPFWDSMRPIQFVHSALRGVNAAVVGVLIAALFTPLWITTVRNSSDFWFALVAFTLLTVWEIQPWVVVCGVSVSSLLVS